MRIDQRIENIEELLQMQKAYLNGLMFTIKVNEKGPYTFTVTFEEIAQWQLNRVRQKFFSVGLKHIEIVGNKILEGAPPPKKKRRRKRHH